MRKRKGSMIWKLGLLSLFSTAMLCAQQQRADPVLSGQRDFEGALRQKFRQAQFVWSSSQGVPLQISRIGSYPLEPTAAAVRSYFANNLAELYKIESPDDEIETGLLKTDRDGSSVLTLYQRYKGVPVYGVSLKLGVDPARRVQSVTGKWLPHLNLGVDPVLNQEQAADKILHYLRSKYAGRTPLPPDLRLRPDRSELVVFDPGLYSGTLGTSHLAYHVLVKNQVFFVDAASGEILLSYSNVQHAKTRKTYNSNDCYELPGTLVMEEAGPVPGAAPDTQTVNAHAFAGMVYDYYGNTFGRDSYDGAGSPIVSTVHSGVPRDLISWIICCIFQLDCCGCDQPNAAWIPSLEQMVYGDGGAINGSESFRPLTDGLDVVAHEITHGVIQYSILDGAGQPVGLDYAGQSGALNESYADLFAAMVDRDDWTLGEDVTIGFSCGALRNLASPRSCGQPDHMSGYDSLGDVHENSGILNEVGYLISEGGLHPFSHIAVEGIGRNDAERVFYRTLTHHLTQTASFEEARAATLLSCEELFPDDRRKYCAVSAAFAACGISDSVSSPCTDDVAEEGVPDVMSVSQNYPNPFNPSTIIEYTLPATRQVMHVVYDLLGRRVAALADGEQSPGKHIVEWKADGCAGGVYYYRLEAWSRSVPTELLVETKRMVLMR